MGTGFEPGTRLDPQLYSGDPLFSCLFPWNSQRSEDRNLSAPNFFFEMLSTRVSLMLRFNWIDTYKFFSVARSAKFLEPNLRWKVAKKKWKSQKNNTQFWVKSSPKNEQTSLLWHKKTKKKRKCGIILSVGGRMSMCKCFSNVSKYLWIRFINIWTFIVMIWYI